MMTTSMGLHKLQDQFILARKSVHTRPARNFCLRPHAVATPNKFKPKSTNSSLDLPSASSELVFIDETTGQTIKVMPADYGFRSGSGRLYQSSYGAIPTSIWELAADNFRKELVALRRSVRYDEYREIADSQIAAGAGPLKKFGLTAGGYLRQKISALDEWLEGNDVLKKLNLPRDARDPHLSPEQSDVLNRVRQLKLNDAKVTQREKRRQAAEGGVDAPWPIYFAYISLCWLIDVPYAGRPIQRFWFLETVARMPYFAYISMLHLYESIGWWRAGAEIRKIHFAEEWNELHHLQILESLGGDLMWFDRFLAEHAAIFYYWVLVIMYSLSPKASYTFSELVEHHAADTYSEFAEQNEELLKTIPPPLVALNYYKAGDLYLFDQLQTGWQAQTPRRPSCNNLYDVFINIRDDENEHIKTMGACKDGSITAELAKEEEARCIARGAQVRVLRAYDAASSDSSSMSSSVNDSIEADGELGVLYSYSSDQEED